MENRVEINVPGNFPCCDRRCRRCQGRYHNKFHGLLAKALEKPKRKFFLCYQDDSKMKNIRITNNLKNLHELEIYLRKNVYDDSFRLENRRGDESILADHQLVYQRV